MGIIRILKIAPGYLIYLWLFIILLFIVTIILKLVANLLKIYILIFLLLHFFFPFIIFTSGVFFQCQVSTMKKPKLEETKSPVDSMDENGNDENKKKPSVCLLKSLESPSSEFKEHATFWPPGWRSKLCKCTDCIVSCLLFKSFLKSISVIQCILQIFFF